MQSIGRVRGAKVVSGLVGGRMTRILAAAFCSLVAVNALAAMPQDYHVVVAYSADDALCKPLADVYQWIAYGQSHVAFYQEDAFADRFRAISLHAPKSLNDDFHTSDSGHPKHAYYRVKLAGEARSRVIYLEDHHSVGHYEDDYMTNIWILKPGADVDDSGNPYNFGPESVDVAILPVIDTPDFYASWRTTDPRFRAVIQAPFFFTKIASKADLALPENKRAAMVPNIGSGTPYMIQRIFLYHGALVILADDKLAFMAYRIKDGAIDEVCDLAQAPYLNNFKSYGRDYLSAIDRAGK